MSKVFSPIWVTQSYRKQPLPPNTLKHLQKQKRAGSPEQHPPGLSPSHTAPDTQADYRCPGQRRRQGGAAKMDGGSAKGSPDDRQGAQAQHPQPSLSGALAVSPTGQGREGVTHSPTPASPAPPRHRPSSFQFLFYFSNQLQPQSTFNSQQGSKVNRQL